MVDLVIESGNVSINQRMILKRNDIDWVSIIFDHSYTIQNLTFDTYELSFDPETKSDGYVFKIDKDGIHEY